MAFLIPYPDATTRDMARANAIELAKHAEEAAGCPGDNPFPERMTSLALVWSRITETFPFDEYEAPGEFDPREMAERNGFSDPASTQVLSTEENYHPQPADPLRATVNPSGVITDAPLPIAVNSDLYDVLRALAMRYVAAAPERRTMVDLANLEEMSGFGLEIVRIPGESTVMVLLESET